MLCFLNSTTVLYHPPAEKLLTHPRRSLFNVTPELMLLRFVPSFVLPISSSSDVIDLERRAMAGGVSLFVCCGAAKGSQPNADLMFRILVYNPLQQAFSLT